MRLLFVLATMAGALCAEANLSGTWTLNHEKSDFGRAPKPGNVVTKIKQQSNELVAQSTADGVATEYKWTLDGKECVNRIRGNDVTAVATWRGPILQVKAKTTIQGVALAMVDQYSLSTDGKEMTIFRTINGPQGEVEQRYVYGKSLSDK